MRKGSQLAKELGAKKKTRAVTKRKKWKRREGPSRINSGETDRENKAFNGGNLSCRRKEFGGW